MGSSQYRSRRVQAIRHLKLGCHNVFQYQYHGADPNFCSRANHLANTSDCEVFAPPTWILPDLHLTIALISNRWVALGDRQRIQSSPRPLQ